jgi:hypothetical protein
MGFKKVVFPTPWVLGYRNLAGSKRDYISTSEQILVSELRQGTAAARLMPTAGQALNMQIADKLGRLYYNFLSTIIIKKSLLLESRDNTTALNSV